VACVKNVLEGASLQHLQHLRWHDANDKIQNCTYKVGECDENAQTHSEEHTANGMGVRNGMGMQQIMPLGQQENRSAKDEGCRAAWLGCMGMGLRGAPADRVTK
jgi:hypothetical protein